MGYEACPNPQENCKFKHPYADRHHLYWPKNEYRTKLEKDFRANFVELCCRCLHDELHALPPPNHPSVEEMREGLNGNPA